MTVAKELFGSFSYFKVVLMVVVYDRKRIVRLAHGSVNFFRLSALNVHVAICDLYFKTFMAETNSLF
jgi:hypothetical protein